MQIDPLAQLKDIHLPTPISWWPLAPGWWLLILMLIFICMWSVKALTEKYRINLYRRQALKKLSHIRLDIQKSNVEKLALVMELLKQAVGSAYQGNNFNSLNNRDFVLFLQNSCRKSCFTQISNDLEISLYSNETSLIDNEKLLKVLITESESWLKNHYSKAKLVRLGLC
jgi:RNase P protein component